ncbi:DsbA family protein [Listeria sp. PSOL-1]|uniref:DsbA family protein n=1 Tax=Listeria sp. PSOL-1 TaxID=1844999 RepID=UPI0013D37C4D|nr:DsbA family protein [Listeria sp. PSOL-1]
MDISQIVVDAVTSKEGIHIGQENAKVKVISFVNLRCPYCRKWHEESREVLDQFIQSGKIELIIKPFDKEKESLQRGNITHRYLNYEAQEETLKTIDRIYETQDEWGHLSLEDVAKYMETTLGLTKQNNEAAAKRIVAEANDANIVFVPTVIVGKHIFDEHITPSELTELLEMEYQK